MSLTLVHLIRSVSRVSLCTCVCLFVCLCVWLCLGYKCVCVIAAAKIVVMQLNPMASRLLRQSLRLRSSTFIASHLNGTEYSCLSRLWTIDMWACYVSASGSSIYIGCEYRIQLDISLAFLHARLCTVCFVHIIHFRFIIFFIF